MFITDALALSHVPRWTVVRTLRQQSTADHSFRVAMITREILTRHPKLTMTNPEEDQIIPVIREANVIWHALAHDIDECVTGDIPSIAKQHLRAKRDIPDLVPDAPAIGVTTPEINVVKLADLIEAYTFLRLEGTGEHAQAVREWLYTRIDDQMVLMDNLIQRKLIVNLIRDITHERGRLRTFEPYDAAKP